MYNIDDVRELQDQKDYDEMWDYEDSIDENTDGEEE